MIVYRCLRDSELTCLIKNQKYSEIHEGTGRNTFDYDWDVSYKHFYVFGAHAEYYRPFLHACTVGIFDIPDELIEQKGFGFYGKVKSSRSEKLASYDMPIPEIIIKEDNYSNSFLICVDSFLSSWDQYEGVIKIGDEEYVYSDIYYDLVYKMGKENNMDMRKVAELLQKVDIKEEIKNYFEKNKTYLNG